MCWHRSGAIEVAVVRSCAHSTVWNGVCTACGEPVTGGVKREASKLGRDDAKYGEFERTNDQVGRLEREAEERLMKARKLSLVLDLDETLINTAREPFVVTAKELTEEVHKAASEGKHTEIKPNEVHELTSHRNHFTKLRPGVEAFLAAASQLCELNIFTKGGREYAADIAKILDPERLYFRDRIISAAECGGTVKNLRRQYPVPDRMVVILDDRFDVWENSNPHNVIRVAPYKFWNDRSSIVPTVDEMHNYECVSTLGLLIPLRLGC
jgi:RNA polymerase II subunit A-like phosphatase